MRSLLTKLIYFFYPLVRLYWKIVGKPQEGVRALLVHENKVLLVDESYYDESWGLVGGFIKDGEHPRDAVSREVVEEIGEQIDYFDFAGVEYIGSGDERVLVYVFVAELSNTDISPEGLEIADARWFPLNQLPASAPTATYLLDEFYLSKIHVN